MSLNDGFKSSEKVGYTGYQLAPYMVKVGLQVGRVGWGELTVNRTPWAGTQKGLERIRITWYRDFVFDKISSCGAIGMLLLRIRSIVTRGHRGNSQVARLAGVVKPWPTNIFVFRWPDRPMTDCQAVLDYPRRCGFYRSQSIHLLPGRKIRSRRQ